MSKTAIRLKLHVEGSISAKSMKRFKTGREKDVTFGKHNVNKAM